MKRYRIAGTVLVIALMLLFGCGGNVVTLQDAGIAEITVVDAYLAVIVDIYKEDDALNSDITIMAIDPQDSILTEEQKEELFAALEEAYGLTIMEKTSEQLSEEGYLSNDGFRFKDGVKISVKKPSFDADTLTFTCGVEKWRSGLGAVGSNEVSASYDGEKWNVTKENIYVS